MLGLPVYLFVCYVMIMFIALPVHEMAHAWTADRFGDDTPRMNGRLTLNPLAHLDVMGSLMMVFVGFGWAKPVPVDPYTLNRHSPAALMWVSLAGPMSNLLLAVLAALPLRFDLIPVTFPEENALLPTVYLFFWIFIRTNLALMLFNLIPLAPLDGEKIADYVFPPTWQRGLDTIRPYGPVILLVLLFVLPRIGLDVVGWLIWPPIEFLEGLLIG